MRIWILPLLAVLTLGSVLWIASPAHRGSPQGRLERARALLTVVPPDVKGALHELDEGLRQARGTEWSGLRPALLRERAKLYAARGLKELALADCRAELAESGPQAETLARATDLCLALGEPNLALEFAQELAALAPARGKGRIGRACLALADAPLAAIERLARSSLPLAASASAATLAQRATVFADDPSKSAVALEDLLEYFPRAEERRRVQEWVREASEHLHAASSAFVAGLEGSTGEAVAGLQDLLARGGAQREAIDLGLVALAIPTLTSPMPVLARTAGALADFGRLETARALILDMRTRNPSGLRPQELSNLALQSELAQWCLLLERLGLWDELRLAAWELTQRAGDERAQRELAFFLLASADLAQDRLQTAGVTLQGLGTNLLDQHDLGVRAWLLRAALARRQRQRTPERHALLLATKAAPLDPRVEPLRADVGRAWQRLYELQIEEGDFLTAEISLTHALRCSSARVTELEPLWHELGGKSLAGRGVSSPYLLHARARGLLERGDAAQALSDARTLLEDYPGLAPALDVVARAAYRLRDFPTLIAAALETLERGWSHGGASAQLRAVPREYFLPEDRVRWLLLDPRGSLEDVLRRLLAKGDKQGAALAARGGPANYQPPELVPLLAEVEYEAGLPGPALWALDALPADSAPFRACTSVALLAGFDRTRQSGQEQPLANELEKVLASGVPADERLLRALDVLLSLGRQREAETLLAWMADGPFLGGQLLRAAAARTLAADSGPTRAVDEDLERAAALLDDGGPELGRLVLASARDDAAALAREARAALETRLAESPARRAALLVLAGEPARAAEVLAPFTLDGRTFELELVTAAVAALAPAAAESGTPRGAAFSPFLLASVSPARLALLALAATQPPWSAWTLARTAELAPATRDDPWIRGLRATSLLALALPDLALDELGPRSDVAILEGLRARLAHARGAPPADVLAAELGWFAASGGIAGEDPAALVLAAEQALLGGARAQAVDILETALERQPNEARLLSRLAELESIAGRRTRALELYNRLLARLPARPDEPHVLAFLDVLRAARDEGEIGEARWWAEVEALEAERPQDPAPARELAARTLERPASAAEQARSHALQRLERFRRRTFERPLETLRAGEAGRWTQLLLRFSPERALAFAEAELLRDPSDPALWRATAQVLLALGRWKEAIERLTALQKVAPERDTGRLLALASYRIEQSPRAFVRRIEDIERFDEQARKDPTLAFYIALNEVTLSATAPSKAPAQDTPVAPEGGAAERALELWRARAENGLADPEHGRALALGLFQVGRREAALSVIEESRALAHNRLERELLATLAYLMQGAPAAPRRLLDVPLPPRLEQSVFDDAPGPARKTGARGAAKGADAKSGASGPGGTETPLQRARKAAAAKAPK